MSRDGQQALSVLSPYARISPSATEVRSTRCILLILAATPSAAPRGTLAHSDARIHVTWRGAELFYYRRKSRTTSSTSRFARRSGSALAPLAASTSSPVEIEGLLGGCVGGPFPLFRAPSRSESSCVPPDCNRVWSELSRSSAAPLLEGKWNGVCCCDSARAGGMIDPLAPWEAAAASGCDGFAPALLPERPAAACSFGCHCVTASSPAAGEPPPPES